jgi:tRNA(adenine34) deaminase
MTSTDLPFMQEALVEAQLALAHDDVPIGAVVVKDGQILGRGHNRREELHSPSAHAEIQALEDAGRRHGHWNLSGAKLYVTLEPCPMCAGAIQLARIEEIVYAAPDEKGGAISLNIPILENEKLNHRVRVTRGPLAAECSQLIKEFFQRKRMQKKTSGKKI